MGKPEIYRRDVARKALEVPANEALRKIAIGKPVCPNQKESCLVSEVDGPNFEQAFYPNGDVKASSMRNIVLETKDLSRRFGSCTAVDSLPGCCWR
jgi:hypothetical protein